MCFLIRKMHSPSHPTTKASLSIALRSIKKPKKVVPQWNPELGTCSIIASTPARWLWQGDGGEGRVCVTQPCDQWGSTAAISTFLSLSQEDEAFLANWRCDEEPTAFFLRARQPKNDNYVRKQCRPNPKPTHILHSRCDCLLFEKVPGSSWPLVSCFATAQVLSAVLLFFIG